MKRYDEEKEVKQERQRKGSFQLQEKEGLGFRQNFIKAKEIPGEDDFQDLSHILSYNTLCRDKIR